jgi:hypothetical protein
VIAQSRTLFAPLRGDLLTNANQAIGDALRMVEAPTQPGEINPCRQALIANFGDADPTTALRALSTTGGSIVMGPAGIQQGPQNVFDGTASLASVDTETGPMPAAQFLAAHPTVSAMIDQPTGIIYLDDSFNDRGQLGRAQDIIHEAVVHRANGVTNIERAPRGSTNPRVDGSNSINAIIQQHCNRVPR